MKKAAVFAAISLLFFLASCKTVLNGPEVMQRSPDTLKKPTETVLLHDTPSTLPRGTEVSTTEDKKVLVTLKQETSVEIRDANIIDMIAGSNEKEIVLPKNTEVVLPEETIVKVVEATPVVIEAGTETVLPSGTEIEVSKINWYALLFYALAATIATIVYFKSRTSPPKKPTPVQATTTPAPSKPLSAYELAEELNKQQSTTTPKPVVTTTPKPVVTTTPAPTDAKAPGDVWQTDRGQWGGKNGKGEIRYYLNKSAAQTHASS